MNNIICISGTSRPGNYTIKALRVVAEELEQSGATVSMIDGQRLSLSFPGQPQTTDAKTLLDQVKSAHGIVLATPEYHGTFSAMTKLVIENLGFPSALAGKPVALVGVAAGRIGAIKTLEQLKGVCSHVGAIVVPGSVSIAGVKNLFDEAGNCTDPKTEQALRGAATSLTNFLKDYVCPKYILEEMVREEEKSWSASI